VPDGDAVPIVSLGAAMTPPASPVDVLAAVIERDGRFLLTRRPEGTHLAGRWEFPGGKCEPGESPAHCLRREISEELGVGADVGEEIMTTEHAYPDRTVRLQFRRCRIQGEPRPRLGQELRWITREEMGRLEFPEADRALIEMLVDRP